MNPSNSPCACYTPSRGRAMTNRISRMQAFVGALGSLVGSIAIGARAGQRGAPLPAADQVRADAGARLRPRRHPACTPNDLRRTYPTWLRADGVPNELSAPTMGHKDTRMLDRVYARLPPELLRLRLLAALGRCSADAVNTSGEGAQRGRTGQPADDVTAGKLAPRAGIEPATHGLTVRCSAS